MKKQLLLFTLLGHGAALTSPRRQLAGQLLEWAASEGAQVGALEPQVFADGMGVGLQATRTIPAEQIALVVPSKLCLSVNRGPGNDCRSPNPFRKAVPSGLWEDMDWFQQLATMLTMERCRGDASPLAPWIKALPGSEELQTLPLFWPLERLSELGCPATAKAVREQRRLWDADATEFALEVEKQLAENKGARGTTLEETPSKEMFLWALSTVRSRSFSGPWEGSTAVERAAQGAFLSSLSLLYIALNGLESATQALQGFVAAAVFLFARDLIRSGKKGDDDAGGYRRYTIAPVVDMLNHAPEASGAKVAYEYFQDAYSVTVTGAKAGTGVAPGEQAFISYGEYPSSALLQYYGFCLNGQNAACEGATRFERVSFRQETALDWLAEDGSKVLEQARDSSEIHWADFDLRAMPDRVRLLDTLSLLNFGPVSIQGRVGLSASVSDLRFDPISERTILALVASEPELRNAGPSLERIQKNGLSWGDISNDTRARFEDVLRSARRFLAAERKSATSFSSAAGDAISSEIRNFQLAQREFLEGTLA